MLEGVPNFAFTVGYTNASWTLKADLSAEYVCRLLITLRRRHVRQCTPHNHDASVADGPLLALNAGYIQRAKDRVPQQGTRFPWQVHESYLKDYRAMKLSKVDDEAMAFTNPEPVGAAPVLTAGADGGQGVRPFQATSLSISGASSATSTALANGSSQGTSGGR